jgi:hypothetical protein
VAADARFAWWALTRACHHHPYELAPTGVEIEWWVSSVERVVAAVDGEGVG